MTSFQYNSNLVVVLACSLSACNKLPKNTLRKITCLCGNVKESCNESNIETFSPEYRDEWFEIGLD